MDKIELTTLLNDIFIPIGFKKKGSYWVINSDTITKIIQLQKSQFSNSFYINYGYILKSIPLEKLTMHVFKRFSSSDISKNTRIKELLNMENSIPNDIRNAELKQLIIEELVHNIEGVNNDNDLLVELKKRPHLNDIPLIVKNYFNLSS